MLSPPTRPPTRLPWSNVYGLARTLLATGLLLTLACTDPGILFDRSMLAQLAGHPSWLLRGNLFVLLRDHLALARLLAMIALGAVAVGWRPRWTAALHWWIAMSFGAATAVADGGDHLHMILAGLLVPVALTDRRRWQWSAPADEPSPSLARSVVIYAVASFLVMATVQMAVVYLHAATGKLAVPEWIDGTATYYWFTDPNVGAPSWVQRLLTPVLTRAAGVLALTWGTLMLELGLSVAALAPPRYRRAFLIGGVGFHVGIIVIHGLVSFFFTMAAGLVLLLRRPHEPFAAPAWARALVERAGPWSRRARAALAIAPRRRRGDCPVRPG